MAVGEVSDNPSGNAVTRPTVTATRDQDIANKLRIYGIFSAFGEGKFPTNKQIDVALNSAIESKMLANPSKQLSEEGQGLVKDLRDVIESAKWLWLKKNYNEELQNFLWHTIQASTTPDSTNINVPVSKDQAQQHGQDALNGLRTLGRLLITNGQFRKLLEDAVLLGRDMAADAASHATGTLRPDQDRLDKIDEPAPDHQWHDTPPSFGEMKDQAKQKWQSATNRAQNDANAVQQDAAQGATGQSDPEIAARRAADEHANQTSRSDIDQQAGANAGLSSAKQRISEKVPDEHKEKAKDVKDSNKQQAKEYLKKKVHPERRDQTINRLKKMVVEIQQHDDYRDAIDTLISLAEEYTRHAKNVAKDTKGEAQRTAGDTNLKKAQHELKTLLENFADGTSMDDIFDAINNLVVDANNDPEFNRWWSDVDRFIRKCLQEEGYIIKDESTEEWNHLQERGQYFLKDRYKEHADRVVDEINGWFDYMAKDPDNVDFGNKVQKLFLDLGQDANGNVVFKKHLLDDVFNVVIPGFFENLRYVPIPRIEVSDRKVDAVIENLVLESENLFPNVAELQVDNFFRMGRKRITNRSMHHFSLHCSQIQCDLKDISYWIHKKQGFPTLTDTGVMDIFIGGHGLSFDIRFATAEAKDRNRIFKVDTVKVKINNMKIVLKKSKYKTLFNIFKPLLMGVVKPAIRKAAEVQIRRAFDQMDEQMWLVQKEYLKAKEAAKNQPPEETKNMVNMYIDAIQKRFTELRKKADEKTPNAKLNVATNKEKSLFPNVHLEGAISSEATKYRQMAREGDAWRSPIFDIGSAKPSSNISAPKEISRKSPHRDNRATINDRPGTVTHQGQGFDASEAFHSQKGSTGGYIPSSGNQGYQPRMSTADSLQTAVDEHDFEGTHVGKYNVTGTQMQQDPMTTAYRQI